MALITWCNRIIRIGFYLLFGLIPLLLTPWNFELFEYNKMMAVYAIAAVVATAWLIKMLKEQQIRITKTPLDIPILLFVTSQIVSAIFSIDPHVSWFGYYSRFNGGVFSVLSYTLLYYAFVSNKELFLSSGEAYSTQAQVYASSKKKDKKVLHAQVAAPRIAAGITRLLTITLATATIVAIYGVLERLGIDKHLWVQDVQNRVFATLGQPNWLAAYLVALIPLSMAFAVRHFIQQSQATPQVNSKQKTENRNFSAFFPAIFYSLISILFFVVLLFTGSRSGLLGFAVADIVFWGLLVMPDLIRHPSSAKQNTGFRLGGRNDIHAATLLHVLFALIIFVNGTGSPTIDKYITFNGLTTTILRQAQDKQPPPATASAVATGPALEVGGTESGVIRKYVWEGALNAWNSSLKTKLIGTGTETFAFAFYEFRPAGHNLTSEWDFLYNKAHNEYLNYLATTGIFGLGSYLLFIGTFIVWFIRTVIPATEPGSIQKKTWIPGLARNDKINYALFAGWCSVLVTNFFGFSVVITQVFLFLFPALMLTSYPSKTTQYAPFRKTLPDWILWIPILTGLYVFVRIGSFWYADTLYARGYRLIRAGLYGQAVPAIVTAVTLNQGEPTYHDELGGAYATLAVAAFEGKNATQAAQLASLATEESNKAISASPRNVNFYKTRTKIYYTLSALDPQLNTEASNTLLQAIPLSPNDPKIYYNLAILVGREGDSEKSIEYLKKAKALKANYRDAYFALWVFYTEVNKPDEATAILEEYVKTVDPNDKDFIERLK